MEPENTPGKGKTFSKPSFSGSMLIFGGVAVCFFCRRNEQLPYSIDYQHILSETLRMYRISSICFLGCADEKLLVCDPGDLTSAVVRISMRQQMKLE